MVKIRIHYKNGGKQELGFPSEDDFDKLVKEMLQKKWYLCSGSIVINTEEITLIERVEDSL